VAIVCQTLVTKRWIFIPYFGLFES